MGPDTDATPPASSGEPLFQELAPNGVVCTVCPHLCVIAENAEGLCKARGVRQGRVVSLTYGRPASVISDEIDGNLKFQIEDRASDLRAAPAFIPPWYYEPSDGRSA